LSNKTARPFAVEEEELLQGQILQDEILSGPQKADQPAEEVAEQQNLW
jgi:hypothetical protein